MRNDAPRNLNPTENWFTAVALSLVLVVLGLMMGAAEIGSWLTSGEWVANPLRQVVDLMLSRRDWSPADTWGGVVVGVPLLGGLVLLLWWLRRRAKVRASASHVDRKAKDMGGSAGYTAAAAAARARVGRLTDDSVTIAPGQVYGRAVIDGAELVTDWRDTVFVEMGPGSGKAGGGKTSGIAIPFVLDAPGNVLATTNKRDLADAVRLACETRGDYWGFDPMRIANHDHGARPGWWWNPLRTVTNPAEAKSLAEIFVDATMPVDSVKHPYFDTKGPTLLSNLILAAALSGQQLPRVYEWLNDFDDRDAITILQNAGLRLSARSLAAAYIAAPEERSGLFGTAANAMEFLVDPAIMEWITDDGSRPEFDPAEFVKPFHPDGSVKRATLLALSRSGDGSAVALTTALVVAVTKAAEKEATRHPHGRLPVPPCVVLDEIANTAPWRKLPSQFSFYGSSGISLTAIIQNWEQAVEAWKQTGAKQLFNASTVRLVGGGLADAQHLADVSKLIGERWTNRHTSSLGHTGRQSSSSPDHEPILSVDELGALDGGRFVLLPAGGYPVLGVLLPWWERPHMDGVVRASRAKYEPKGAPLTVPDPEPAAPVPDPA